MSDFTLTFGDPLRVSVTVPEGATQVALSTSDSNVVVVQNALAVTGGTGAAGAGVPVGGTAGQSLVKLTDADYSTQWADRLASVVEDTSPELGGDLNTAGNAITFEDEGGVAAGSLAYDVDEKTVAYTNASGISIELGEKNVFYGKAAEAISKGDVVMFGGVQGNHLLLKKADQSAPGFIPEWVVGFSAQALSTNDFGYVVWFGKLDGLSGYPTSTYSGGELLYLDPATPGGVTTTEPLPAAGHSILLAAVLTPSNGSSGRIIIRPTHKQDTDEVPEGSTNLYYTAARARADVLTLKTSDLTLDDVTRIVNLQASGRLVFRDSGSSSLLYIDEANAYVGVGNVTPTAGLHVATNALIGNNLEVDGSEVRLADSATIGVDGGERFTIGKITGAGSANITINGAVDATNTFQISNTTGLLFGGSSGNSLGASTAVDFSFTKNGSGSANYKFDNQVSQVSFENTTSVNLRGQLPLRLYDSDSSNYVGIQPPATVAADYTLTLPDDAGTSGYVLSTNGSGVTSWVAQSGGATVIDDLSDVDTSTVAPTPGQALVWDGSQWEPGTVSVTNTNIANSNLTFTADRTHEMAGYQVDFQNSSSSVFLLTETGAVTCGDVTADSIILNAKQALSGAGTFASGATILAGLYTSGALTGDRGEVYYLGSTAGQAIATGASTASGMLGVVTGSENQNEFLIKGVVRVITNLSTSTKGDIVYLDPSTVGRVTTTAPTGSGQIVRILGYVVNPSNNMIYFDPSPDWIELVP